MTIEKNLIHRLALLAALLAGSASAGGENPSVPDAVATRVAAGGLHNCALTTAGAVLCWGYNFNGQLGNNSTSESHVPVALGSLTSGVMAIAAGGLHTCALTTAGAVQCWGFNQNGRLGNNSTTDSHVPVAVSGLGSGVMAITAGGSHTCALTTAGAVQCWGSNHYGQLGNNSPTDSSVPVAVSGLGSGVVAIVAGGSQTCALTTAGAMQCWGFNFYGQLGNNSTTDSHVPVPVSGLGSGVVAITSGDLHTCALTTAGGAWCWGANVHGQLGNASTIDSLVPVAVSGYESGVVAVVAGHDHTCALTTMGGAQCWGYNSNGQLGNNSTTDSHVPVAVSGLGSGVMAITAGDGHTCALTTASGALCWGNNVFGQLGNNLTVESHVPVAVRGLGADAVFVSGFDS